MPTSQRDKVSACFRRRSKLGIASTNSIRTSVQTLCTAALEFYQEGYKTAEEVSTLLIGTYVGFSSTRVNSLRQLQYRFPPEPEVIRDRASVAGWHIAKA
ncbi:hypothetical protein OS035_29000 [Rhizobium sp. 268]|uniref:hypothetical protein n=1 Tax=unclassified Rhizobium TaxID=2613769 RepID=UPI00160F3525|nr:hypothetical protein [Rhizobium sp. BK456]MBB3527080.1 hypothetical protein [Rhizobium sp. BK456]